MRNKVCEERMRAVASIGRLAIGLTAVAVAMLPPRAAAQINTTTVQGTVYRADGTPAGGTLLVSWPAFTTPQNQAVAAGTTSAAIGADGFVSLNLTPNAAALPTGSYYTAIYHLSDGTVNQEYWVVPASATASIASVRAQLQPSTVAVQPVSKSYLDSAIASLNGSWLPVAGGTMTGPLTLNGDPVAANQATTKHYSDQLAAAQLSLSGGTLTGPLTAPQITVGTLSATLATTDLGRTNRVSVKECGAHGDSTSGTDGNDDTSAINACLTKLENDCGGTLFFPAGLYRVTSTLRIQTSASPNCAPDRLIRIEGDSRNNTGIVLNHPTASLFTLALGGPTPGWQETTFENITLYGLGSATLGNAIEDIGPVHTHLLHMTINGFGGIGFMQDGERASLEDVQIKNTRVAWAQGATATNETYAHDLLVWNPGATLNPFTNSAYYSWDANAVNGVEPGPNQGPNGGPTPVVENMHTALVLAGNSVNNKIDGCSIKPLHISAIRVIHGENIQISHCYFESFSGIRNNLSIINGGYNVRSASTTALPLQSNVSLPRYQDGSGTVAAWTVSLSDGSWFRNRVTYTHDLVTSIGDAGTGSTPYIGYIIPPDFSWGSTAPSTIGGGILQGNYEQVALYGTIGNSLYIQSRAYNGTTAYAWPSGAVFVEGDGTSIPPSDSLHLTDNHHAAYMLAPGYSVVANPNLGEPNGAEIVNGWMPDPFLVYPNHYSYAPKYLLFDGNDRNRSLASIESHSDSGVTLAGGLVVGNAWNNSLPNFDMAPTTLGIGGTITTVTYSNNAHSAYTICMAGGSCANSSGFGLREYLATYPALFSGKLIDTRQFFNAYSLCDAAGSGNNPLYCNYLDNSGVWQRLSYNGTGYSNAGSYAITDSGGNLTISGSVRAHGSMTAAAINGEITVDGTTYTTLNAAWSSAVSQANASGQNQTIRLGAGSFAVTATLAEPTNGACVSLIGSASPTVTADNANASTVITVPSSLGGDLFRLQNTAGSQAQSCTFRNLLILANRNASHAFNLQWFRGLYVDDVTVNDTTQDAFYLGETSGSHQANFEMRNVTVSYSASSFTPASRPNYGLNLQSTVLDSFVQNLMVRNALQAAVYNAGSGTTFELIHGFGYPYTCTTAPCNNATETNSGAADASWATNYEVVDAGSGGNMYFNTYMDSPAIAAFDLKSNGVQINGGHIQWPETNSFPNATFAEVESTVNSNLVISNVDCLNMSNTAGIPGSPAGNSGVWISYMGTNGSAPSYSSVSNLAGCGQYVQQRVAARQTAFDAAGNNSANTNYGSGQPGVTPKIFVTPLSTQANEGGVEVENFSGGQGDAFFSGFSGQASNFAVMADGTVRHTGLQTSTVFATTSTTLTKANHIVLANASSGALTLTLPSCYTAMPDGLRPTGMELTIVKTDATSNAVQLATTSSETISVLGSSASSYALTAAGGLTLACGPDSNWYSTEQITAASTSAATASALATTPAQCPAGSYATGIGANGNANCAQSWRSTWYGYFGGTFGTSTNNSLGAIWSPSAAISMTRLDVAVGTAPAGCSTWPVIGIYDGTASTWLKTVTLAAGTYSYRNAVSGVSLAAGHNLSMGVQTAGVGCSTNPGSAQLTVEYTMNQ